MDSHGHIDQLIGKHKSNFFNTMNVNKCVCVWNRVEIDFWILFVPFNEAKIKENQRPLYFALFYSLAHNRF